MISFMGAESILENKPPIPRALGAKSGAPLLPLIAISWVPIQLRSAGVPKARDLAAAIDSIVKIELRPASVYS